MSTLITIIVTFFAGMGAGLGTGFAGLSAAAVISPMLITFLGMDPYMAVGIALSSDVLASAVSAYTYGKNKNLDVKNGLIMMVTVLCFTVVGSYVSSLVPSATMGNFSVFMTFLLGIKFIVRPVMTTKEAMQGVSAKKRAIQSIICGVLIGFICGFIGAGGGMMMLLILTSVLGYELTTAVGTSIYHGIYSLYRSFLALCHRWKTGLVCAAFMYCIYTPLGENCSGLCKQGIRKNLKPCHRYCACNTWHRGICIFTSELIFLEYITVSPGCPTGTHSFPACE